MTNKRKTTTQMIMGKNQISNLKFNSNITPIPTERNKGNRRGSDVMVMHGVDNLYPNWLLYLYSNSTTHQAIIKNKADMIMGADVVYKGGKEKAEFFVNEDKTVKELLKLVTKDYLIFGYYSIECIYNSVGELTQLNHIPAEAIRTNKSYSKFWYCDDWCYNSNQVIEFDAWKRDVKDDFTSKIYFHIGSNPSIHQTYREPEYHSSKISIENEISIQLFHKNNLENGFSGQNILTFHNGEPEESIKEHLEKQITENFTGTSGKKLIINYANDDSRGAEITSLNSNDWNTALVTLKDSTIQDIITAHNVTNPLLLGIKTPGQLGGGVELENSYEIFRTYLSNRRDEIVESFNKLIRGTYREIDIVEAVKIFDKNGIMTINEMRAEKNLPPLKNGDQLESEVAAPATFAVMQSPIATPAPTTSKFSKDDEDEDELKFNSISHLGYSKEDFVHLRKHAFSKTLKYAEDSRLTNYLVQKSPFVGKSLTDIRSALDNSYSLQAIREEIAKLVVSKVIPATKIIDQIDVDKAKRDLDVETIDNRPNYEKIQVMYTYEGAPIDDKTRNFCKRIQNLDRYWSREDIQTISETMGYDCFVNIGGRNCRHSWVAHSVVKKGGTK
ncbi:phage portal family protein [Sphingobacterium chungjuense]|uniref:hypothetical protein n=1 Tax=Sphingobacterium chungjuense TaxID=2675553 RepID=UPI0014099BCD|nr:hypothetical protein [Sphingobacterium chungjuense]